MKKLLIILFFSLFLSGCTIQGTFNKKPAGLTIKSTPASTIFLDGQNKGETPYENSKIKPGEHTVRLVPKSQDNLSPWSKTFHLTPQATTVINKTFAPVETESSSYILELQPEANKQKTYLSIISDPDTASITLDGKPWGFTPKTKKELEPGNHSLEISSPGFKSVSIGINPAKGYNLIVKAKLAREIIILEQKEDEATESAKIATESAKLSSPSPQPQSSLSPSPTEKELEDQEVTDQFQRPYVTIKETGTGWLRVRNKPNTNDSEEIGKVNVGEKLKYLEANDTGWYKVIFEKEEGWISGKYAELYR